MNAADRRELSPLGLAQCFERLSGRSTGCPPNTSWIIGEAMPIT
jgi:hypothetical protein